MNISSMFGIASALVSIVACSSAFGVNEVRVELRSFGSLVSTLRFNNDAPINLNIPTTVDQVNIFPHNFNPASVPTLGRITLIGTGSNPRTLDLRVILGSGGFPASGVPLPLAAVAFDWKGIGVATTNPDRLSQSQVKLAGAINGSLLSPNGIQVGEISRFDFGGNVLASIETNHSGIYPMRIFAGASIIATVEATQGNIRDVQASTLIANILAPNGNIATVRASGDMPVLSLVAGGSIVDVEAAFNIGEAATPAIIVSNGGNIHRVVAGGSAYVDIQAIAPSPNGILATLSASGTSGVFRGSVNVRALGSLTNPNADGRMVFAGDLDGFVQVQSNLPATNPGDSTLIVGDEFLPTSTIVIGGSVTAGSNPGGLRFAPGKLRGQVIINDNNAGGTWDANVRLGTGTPPTFLAPRPAYSAANASLGNGSVGLVPFRLHNTSSVPANQALILAPGEAPTLPGPTSLNDVTDSDFRNLFGQGFPSIVLEFYGPVKLPHPESGPPVRVKLVSIDCTTPYDFTDTFSFAIATDPANPALARRLVITAKPNPPQGRFVLPGTYQVTLPTTGGLLCDIPGNTNVRVADFQYNFRLFKDCDLDGTPFDGGNINNVDTLCSLYAYCDPIDFNRNQVYPEDQDVIDFFNVLAGGECPYPGVCDTDFNNNGVFPEDADVTALFEVLAGSCINCFLN